MAASTIDHSGSGSFQPPVILPQTDGAPVIRRLTSADLHDALRLGWEDFKAMPSHAFLLCIIYPVLGIVLARAVLGYSVTPLLFPLAAGFALIGPFAALGLYELSRRRERGEQPSVWDAAAVLRSPSFGAMLGLGVLLLALFAIVALCISVVAFPMMLDRHASAADGILTSLRVVAKNPVAMAEWGFIVAALLVLGSLPFFLGLAVVLPLLGHATWHLYRKAVEPPAVAYYDHERPAKGRRYAADFPVSLLPWGRNHN